MTTPEQKSEIEEAPPQLTAEEIEATEEYKSVVKNLQSKWSIPELSFGRRSMSEADLLSHLKRRFQIPEFRLGRNHWSEQKVARMIKNAPEDTEVEVSSATFESLRREYELRLLFTVLIGVTALSTFTGPLLHYHFTHGPFERVNRPEPSDDQVSTSHIEELQLPDLSAIDSIELQRYLELYLDERTFLDSLVDSNNQALVAASHVVGAASDLAQAEFERQDQEARRVARRRERERERERERLEAETAAAVASASVVPEHEEPVAVELEAVPRYEVVEMKYVSDGAVMYREDGTPTDIDPPRRGYSGTPTRRTIQIDGVDVDVYRFSSSRTGETAYVRVSDIETRQERVEVQD